MYGVNMWSCIVLLSLYNEGESLTTAWIFNVVYTNLTILSPENKKPQEPWIPWIYTLSLLPTVYCGRSIKKLHSILWALCGHSLIKSLTDERCQILCLWYLRTTLLPRCLKESLFIQSAVSLTATIQNKVFCISIG